MLLVYSKNKFSLLYLFFIYFVLEVCIGGAGGIFKFGPLTLRKLNFILVVLVMLYVFFEKKKIQKDLFYLTIGQFLLLGLATFIGFFTYEDHQKVFENLLMQSFFLVLPLYGYFINTEKQVKTISNIIVWSAIIMAIGYLMLLLSIFVFNFITFDEVWLMVSDSEEMMGRGDNAFFYKGFLYMCIGVFFLEIYSNNLLKRLGQFLLLVAIYLTFTRGFLLALFLTLFCYYIGSKKIIKAGLIILFALIGFILFSKSFSDSSFDRGESDMIRVTQLKQVQERITPISFLIGHGFGEGVPIRDNHMEINYLEIFHKQGFIGLLYWVFILIYIIVLYKNTWNKSIEPIARPFLLGSLFVYFQSATNPFLTNSIGLHMVMLSLVCLKTLSLSDASKE